MPYQPIAWITHPECRRHRMSVEHPECPERLDAIEDRLKSSGLYDFFRHVEAPAASIESLQRVHAPAHVSRILHADTRNGPVSIDSDTMQGEHTLNAALHAAGAAICAVDRVMNDEASLAFGAVRPPGHHAERSRAMGFCFFNNVAVGAAYALSRGLARLAILDFDLHYGNGTADIFMGDDRVRLYSTYQHPLYPFWTGAPQAANLIDVALAPFSGSAEMRNAVVSRWLPALEEQRPELILVSAGFDAHADDPMGDLRWSTDDYRWLGAIIKQVAEACCGGRVVAMLEGGYSLNALGRCVESFLRPFAGEEVPL